MIDFLKFKVKGKGPLKIDLNRQCVSMSVRKKFKKRYNKALLCHSKIIIERNLWGCWLVDIPVNPLENKAVNTGPDWKKNVM